VGENNGAKIVQMSLEERDKGERGHFRDKNIEMWEK
jgi:hypothetical protein